METPPPPPQIPPQIPKPVAAPAPVPGPTSTTAPSQESKSKSLEEPEVVKVANGWKTKTEKEGFIYVSVKGTAKERGEAHGELLADRIIKFIRTYAYYVYDHTGYTIHLFIEMMADLFMSKSSLDDKYKEIVKEIEGIAAGVVKAVKEGKITDETKKNITASTEPPRINLTSESFYSASESSVAIDAKVIFLLNGIVSLFYIFPHLEKLLDTPEYSKLKEKPIYAEFLSRASYKFVADAAASKDSSSTSTSTPLKKEEEEPSLLQKLFKIGSGGDKCSAFMAIGEEYTKGGQIVCAHITFDDFMSGQFDNIILNLQTATSETPSSVSADMLMQTFPGGIFSSTDFFMTTHGFIGTETTIGGFDSFELKAPICFRARKAMQYGKTLEDYVTFLCENNSGDYANTWYIGKVKKTETDTTEEQIMRLELGRRFVKKEVISKGYFIGFNACYDPRIRNIECSNDGFYDSRRHSGARRIRLEEIMRQCKAGGVKIDENVAIKMISDHKDVYLDKESNPCSRTICAHYDEDKREYMSDPSRPKPNQPRGAVDAKVGSSELFRKNRFLAIWGRACGAPFIAKEFCEKHIQWANQEKYLEDRPTRSWVECNCVLADKDTDAPNALKIYKESVYKSGDSDIFSSSSSPPSSPPSSLPSSPPSSLSASPTLSPKPSAPAFPKPLAASAPSATNAIAAKPLAASAPSATNATATINGAEPLSIEQQQQQQQRGQRQLPDGDDDGDPDFDDLGGGKYNKKDMKMFMKMLKSKNKKSTKQVTKNRNTKKNKQ
jgi:hypothetical protein